MNLTTAIAHRAATRRLLKVAHNHRDYPFRPLGYIRPLGLPEGRHRSA